MGQSTASPVTSPQGRQTLYRPAFEHDACGIGALASIKGRSAAIRSSMTLSPSSSTLSTEAALASSATPETAPASSFRFPTDSFARRRNDAVTFLPNEGDYGVAMLFLPRDERAAWRTHGASSRRGCAACGIPLLFWRSVPVDPHDLGSTAQACMPTIMQAFLGRPQSIPRGDDFERALYVCRREIEKRADVDPTLDGKIFYICSMSARTIVYKGMLVATQMRRLYSDLNDAAVKTAVALVHSVTRPTPRPAGNAPTPIASSSTMARSTP